MDRDTSAANADVIVISIVYGYDIGLACVAQGARIGFHAASYLHDLSRKTLENIGTIQRDQYLKAGLPEPFISEIMETPNSRVWYRSRKELREARVTTEDCP